MKTTILILISSIAIGLSAGIVTNSIKDNHKEEILKAELAECQRSSELYNEFKSAMRNITTDPYNREFNNCYDHSKLLQKAFADMGIESSIFISKDRDHAWVAPWMEATTGQFIMPGRYTVLEVRDINLDVICD